MAEMTGRKYPNMIYPAVNFPAMVNDVVEHQTLLHKSGQMTASIAGYPLAAPKTSGKIKGVYLSVAGSGKDDTNPLSLAGNVYINGVSCLTTQPAIAHVSGEAAQQKTTHPSQGDTGITQAVIDVTANSYAPGDIISGDLMLTRTSSPTTEMNNAIMVVLMEPDH